MMEVNILVVLFIGAMLLVGYFIGKIDTDDKLKKLEEENQIMRQYTNLPKNILER